MILLPRPPEFRDAKPLDRTRTDSAHTHCDDLRACVLAQVGGILILYSPTEGIAKGPL